MAAHADAHNRYFGHIFVRDQIVVIDIARALGRFHRLARAINLIDGAREGHIRAAFFGDVLHDHVDIHASLGQRSENGSRNARTVRHRDQGHFRFVTGIGHTGHCIAFHDFLLGADQRACILVIILKTRQHPQADAKPHRQLDRAGLQHLGPQRGQFQHLLKGDLVELARLVRDARVRRVNAIHIGVDVATLGLERGRKGHRSCVRAATAKRGDPALGA